MNKFITLSHLRRVVSAITNRFKSLENAVEDIEETKADVSYVDTEISANKGLSKFVVTVTEGNFDAETGTDSYSADYTFHEILSHTETDEVIAVLNNKIHHLVLVTNANIYFANISDTKVALIEFHYDEFSNPTESIYYSYSFIPSLLSQLEDVYASWPNDGQVLAYNGTTRKWVNTTLDIPSAATATPLMDGTAVVGSSSKYAKEDHVHPSDTKKANVSDVNTLRLNMDTVTTIGSTPLTFSDDTWTVSNTGDQLTKDGYYSGSTYLTYAGALRFILVSNNGTSNPFTNQLFVISNVLNQEYAEYTLDGIVDEKVYHLIVKMNTNSTATILSHAVYDISSSLSGLTDTTISSPTNGQVLSYDTSTSKWVNTSSATYTLSMTNNVITLTGSDGSTSSITLPIYNGGVS